MPAELKSPSLRVIGIVAENVKKLRLVEIKPKKSAGVIEVSGANGSGKTSLLDCFLWALGGERTIQSQPIRDGEEEARITLDLGEIKVTRTFRRDGSIGESHLVVESEKGAHYKAPQRLLDDLLSNLTFDPLEFADGMNAKEQLETLRALVPLEIDIDALDIDTQRAFDTRTGVGRDLKALEARVAAYLIGPEWPTETIDVTGLLGEMEAAGEHNRGLEIEIGMRRTGDARIESARQRAADYRAEAARLLKQAQDMDADVIRMTADREQLPALPEPVDVTMIRAKIEDARIVNEKVRLYQECLKLSLELKAKQEEHEALTRSIDGMRARRRDAIANAPMPVPGLGFGEGEVTFNGLPFAQASSAQRLRVSLAIAMAMNPKLRVIRITNGSLLDEDSLDIVRTMAEERGYQVWVEMVDTSGTVGIYMEEGAVVAVDREMADALI